MLLDVDLDRKNFQQLQLLKEQAPHLKTLLSVGGWTRSGRFSDVALTAASRQQFAESCVQLITPYGFDGLDIDWEYPVSGGKEGNVSRPEDKQNYTLLLAELRQQLNAQGERDGRDYFLTIAAPAAPSLYTHLELNLIHESLDWINIMAYDFHGSWSQVTNFSSPLYDSSTDPHRGHGLNANSAIQGYLAAGIPPNKIVLGVPFYGRRWTDVPDINNGLYQNYEEAFDFLYRELTDYENYTRHWHDEAQMPWLYNPSTGIMISYEDPESLGIKANVVIEQQLGGIMFWEASLDDEQHSLVNTLYTHLNPLLPD